MLLAIQVKSSRTPCRANQNQTKPSHIRIGSNVDNRHHFDARLNENSIEAIALWLINETEETVITIK